MNRIKALTKLNKEHYQLTDKQRALIDAFRRAASAGINSFRTVKSYTDFLGGEFFLFSTENKKLVPNKETRFLIWNIPAILTCPYATDECADKCYARKAEKNYPDCLPARVRNYEISKRNWFIAAAVLEIQLRLNTPAFKAAKHIYIRIHESGDFYSRAYVLKWIRIASAFVDDPRIKFVFYTKSFLFFDGVNLPENMVPTASIWADTSKEQIARAARLNWQVYSADTEENIRLKKAAGARIHVCRCADCARCAFCYNRHAGARTEVVIH